MPVQQPLASWRVVLCCLAIALTFIPDARPAFGSWQVTYIAGTESGNGYGFDADDIVIADGRGDGLDRVYALRYYFVSDGIFSEFSFADSSWSETYAYTEAGLPSSSTTNRIRFGDARQDGITRGYVPASWFTFHEFTYISPSWQRELGSLHNPGSSVQAGIYSGVVGDGRNDGTARLYTYGGALMEATWNPAAPEQDWFHNGDTAYVDGSIEAEYCFVDDARGDGTFRVYAVDYDGSIYEYEWGGSDWTRTSVGSVAASVGDLVVGAGRNDGITRLYAAGQDNTVYEFTWTGSWGLTSTFEPQYADYGIRRLAVGPGRNDGVQRVYWASSGTVGELTWGGSAWTEDRSLNSGLAHNCGAIAVGAARQDGIPRVYTGDLDGYIVEYTFEADTPDLEVTSNTVSLNTVSELTQDQSVAVYNAGSGSFDWTVSGDDESWLTVSPMSGTTSTEHDTLTITVDPTGLTDGQSYSGSFTLSRDGAPEDTETVSVSFTYDAPDVPDLEVNKNSVALGTISGTTTDTSVYVYNAGTGSFSWTVSESVAWLTVSPMSGTTSTEHDTLTITVDPTGLTDGQSYSGSFTLSRDGAPEDAETVAVTLSLAAEGQHFLDVDASHWAFEEIEACYEAGVVQGFADGTYRPDLLVNRGQMAVYIARALAGGDDAVPPDTDGPSFSDVTEGGEWGWCYHYVEYCAANGIVQGYWDGAYRPDVIVNRGQMAVYIARAVAGGDAAVPPDTDGATFTDVTDSGEWGWCYHYIEYCAGNGIVHGYPDNTYRPANAVTRDQMAVYVARAFDLPM